MIALSQEVHLVDAPFDDRLCPFSTFVFSACLLHLLTRQLHTSPSHHLPPSLTHLHGMQFRVLVKIDQSA